MKTSRKKKRKRKQKRENVQKRENEKNEKMRMVEAPNPEKVGAWRVGARRVGSSKFCLIFSLTRRTFRSFFSIWGLVRGIVAAVQGHGPPRVRVSASRGHFVRATAAPKIFQDDEAHESDCHLRAMSWEERDEDLHG